MPHPSSRRIALSLLLALSAISLIPAAVLAWSYHTHRKICSDALNRMPPAFIQQFMPFKDRFLQGSTDPDTTLKDFYNHIYHTGARGHSSLSHIQKLFDQGADLARSGNSNADLAYTLGLLSHYIADINQPLHTAGKDGDPNESDYHATFEKDVQGQMSKIPVGEIRYDPVTDVGSRLDSMATKARVHYEAIGEAYRRGNRLFDLKPMVDQQYTAAVQNVVDFWLGVLKTGGQNPDLTAVPTLSRTVEEAPARGGLPQTGSQIALDLNTATREQLMEIPGIKAKRAEAIIDARPFKSIYDLSKIQSGGKKLFDVKLIERLSDRIKVGP